MRHTPLLTDQQESEIIERTRKYTTLANSLFNLRLRTLEIRFDVNGSAWGYFIRDNRNRYFRYNPSLFAIYFAEGLDETIPHEVAHYVVDQRFPRRRCKPHGVEWKAVMRAFGIEQPRATHTANLDGLNIRRQQRFSYYCGCGEITLSATRHNRIIHKNAQYLCRKCHQLLSPEIS